MALADVNPNVAPPTASFKRLVWETEGADDLCGVSFDYFEEIADKTFFGAQCPPAEGRMVGICVVLL